MDHKRESACIQRLLAVRVCNIIIWQLPLLCLHLTKESQAASSCQLSGHMLVHVTDDSVHIYSWQSGRIRVTGRQACQGPFRFLEEGVDHLKSWRQHRVVGQNSGGVTCTSHSMCMRLAEPLYCTVNGRQPTYPHRFVYVYTHKVCICICILKYLKFCIFLTIYIRLAELPCCTRL